MDKRKPGARRWFVLLGAHVSMIVFCGTYRSLGVLLVEWKRYFHTSSAQISGIVSILGAASLLSGIPSGMVITRYGSRVCCLLGATAFISGTLASVFATSPIVLCFTSGFISGLGVSFVRNSALAVVAQYFMKGHTKANGVVIAGSSVGIMLVPPLLQLCVDRYGWRGAMLILVGIQAQLIVVALVYERRPPLKITTTSTSSSSTERACSKGGSGDDHGDGSTSGMVLLKARQGELDRDIAAIGMKREESSVSDSAEIPSEKTTLDNQYFDTNTNKLEQEMKRHCHNFPEASFLQNEGRAKEPRRPTHHIGKESRDINNHELGAQYLPLIDDQTENRSHESNELIRKSSSDNDYSEMQVEQTDKAESDIGQQRAPRSCNMFLTTTGLGLFGKNVGFTLFTLSQFPIGMCYSGVLTHFVASAVYEGIDEQSASFLFSVLGIASLVARLTNGWLIDLNVLSPEYFYVIAMVIYGTSMILSRVSHTYGWYVFIGVCMGLASGTFRSLNPMVVKKFVGAEHFARALGVFYACTAVGDLIGPVFAGAMYDVSGTYDIPFYVAGSLLIASSSLLLFEPPLRRYKERRHAVKSHQIHTEENVPHSDAFHFDAVISKRQEAQTSEV